MITVDNIIEWAKPHAINSGKRTIIETDDLVFSIVGGASGLYGDFLNDFEFAIINKNNNDFITKFFFPESNDDVIGYMKGDELIDFLNRMTQRGFQVK